MEVCGFYPFGRPFDETSGIFLPRDTNLSSVDRQLNQGRETSRTPAVQSAIDQISQNARRMVAWVYLIVDTNYRSVLTDQKTLSLGVTCRQAIAGSVGGGDRVIGIAQEGEGEAELVRESGVLFGGVEARAEHHDTEFVEVALMVAEPAALKRSAGRVGLDEELEQHLTAAQCRKRNDFTVVSAECEVRRRIARPKHCQACSEANRSWRRRQLSIARSCASIRPQCGSPGAISRARSNSRIACNTIPLAA